MPVPPFTDLLNFYGPEIVALIAKVTAGDSQAGKVLTLDANGELDGVAIVDILETAALIAGTADGLNVMRVAKATFNPSLTAAMRTVAAHGLGVTIPDKAIVVGGFVNVLTTFQSTAGGTDKATIALSVEGAGDLVAAVAIETGTPWDAGRRALIPKANTPESTSILLTAARELTATVAVAALTAGKLEVFVYYLPGA